MGIVQDTLCGVRKFTLRDTFLDWNQVQNILLWVPDWDGSVPIPAIIKPKPLWTGKQILSMTIPRGINIQRSSDSKTSNPVFDDGMMIENGEITAPVQNFRWNETPVVGLNNISALGVPEPMHTGEAYDQPGTAMIPAMRIEDFTMTSVSPAV